jgi:hypothetical protein
VEQGEELLPLLGRRRYRLGADGLVLAEEREVWVEARFLGKDKFSEEPCEVVVHPNAVLEVTAARLADPGLRDELTYLE